MTEKYALPLCDSHALLAWSEVNMHIDMRLSDEDRQANLTRELRYRESLEREAMQAMPRQLRPGYIYFIKVGGQIKIGYASDIYSRVRAYPPTSTLLAYYPGNLEDERVEHQSFKHCRIGGREWYEPRPDIEDRIAAIKKQWGAPDLGSRAPKRTPTGRQPVSLRSRSGGTFKR